MPYFNVQLSENVLHEFIINATDRVAAQEAAADAVADGTYDYRKIINVRHDTQISSNVQDADKTDWDQALKKRKVK